MSDWYDTSKAKLILDMSRAVGLTDEQARAAYEYLSNVGLIDYDIEKDVLWDEYVQPLEDDD